MTAAAGTGVSRLAHWVAGLSGWRRRLFAAALGGLAVFALPPVFVLPVLVVSFTGLLWLIEAAPTKRAAFFDGWWFGVGYFALGLYWISFALLTDPAQFGWMIPFAIGGLSASLAVYPGLAAALVRWSGRRGVPAVLLLAVAWTGAEWLRGVLFTGFPWNPIGHVWLVTPATAQLAAVTGVYGLSMVAVAVAAMPATLRLAPCVAAAVAVAALWAGGAWRLPPPAPDTTGVPIRIVQPNIPQTDKWRPDLLAQHLAREVSLTVRNPGQEKIVVWPEAAVPFYLSNEPDLRKVLGSVVPRDGLLITGALRATKPGERPRRVWNSAYAIDSSGTIVATYDKFHLVPFGEYVPEPFLTLFGLVKITHGATPFSAGPGPVTMALPGFPSASVLICYEAIFPGDVVGAERPAWMVNLTNDAWFGRTAGPHQHFASARMRTIEEGLPLVRAANTGISGVIDAYGRVVARLRLGRTGVLDARLPPPLPTATIFARYGNAVPGIFGLLIALGTVAWRPRKASQGVVDKT